jgi:hypothetical protein
VATGTGDGAVPGASPGPSRDPEGRAGLDAVASELAAALGEALRPAVVGASLAECPCLPLVFVLRPPAAGDGRRGGRAGEAGTAQVWVGEPSPDRVGRPSGELPVTVGRLAPASAAALVVEAALDDLPDLLGDPKALAVSYMQGRTRLEGRTGSVLGLLGWWTGPGGEPVREVLRTHLAGSPTWGSLLARRSDSPGAGSASQA